MRLIDADAINFEDICDCCPSADCGDCPGPEGFASWFKKQPTAYDIDKVVKQLEEKLNEPRYQHDGEDYFVGIIEAIEIVKSGGKV